MKVKELKTLLTGVPDDLEVVVSGTAVCKASQRGRHLSQFYGHEHEGDDEYHVVDVFWIDDGSY